MSEPLDELFTLPPEEFTARRDALVKELKAAKEGDLAAKVKGLRRPTIPAWALNQVARTRTADVEALIKAGEQLAAAQRRLMGGDRSSGIREATQERRAAVATLRDHAAEVLRDAGIAAEPHLDEIAGTLEAASADPDAADAFRAGMLSKPLPPPSGLGFGFLPAPADDDEEEPAEGAQPEEPAEEVEEEDEDAAAARAQAEKAAAVEDAERRLAEARTARDAASEREDDAHRAAAEATQRLAALRKDLARAEQEAERTAQDADAASDAVQEAEEEVAAAGATLRKLRR